MKITRCDRCGKEITQGETYWVIRAIPSDPLGKPMFAEPTGCDLCIDCGEELNEWLHPPGLREIRARAFNLRIEGDGK